LLYIFLFGNYFDQNSDVIRKDRGFYGDGGSEGRMFLEWWHFSGIYVGDDA